MANKYFNKSASAGLVLIIQMTEKCNLRCRYCYIPRKKRVDMPLKVAYQTVSFAAQMIKSKYSQSVTLCFHGGEPTVAFGLVRKIVRQAKRANIDKFIIGTNAIAINEKRIKFMVANNFSPTISIDGIARAQNLNRPFIDGRGSWKEVDRSLDLFGKYADFWFNKYIPDPLRIRISLTPETLPYLAESVRYFVRKRIGKSAAINIMPVMGCDIRWQDYYAKGILLPELRKQMRDIADFYIERLIADKPFSFCINECLTPQWSALIDPLGITRVPFCGAGGLRILGISLDGGIYPCYLHAANPARHKSMRMGDVFSGITNPAAAVHFCGSRKNENFSCLFWNILENGDPGKPALIYSLLYDAWREAVFMVSDSMQKNNKALIRRK